MTNPSFNSFEPVILRPAIPAITLDDALLSMSTFANGCDFRLVQNITKNVFYIEIGCYGVHPNLLQGHQLALYNWVMGDPNKNTCWREIIGARPETIHKLLERPRCSQCLAPHFRD